MVTTKKNISRQQIKRKTNKFIKKNDIIDLLDDNIYQMKKGKILNLETFSPYINNTNPKQCICEFILKQSKKECECSDLIKFKSQGKSGGIIYSIICNKNKNILKVIELNEYYIKYRLDTNKYHFIEVDKFTQQILINKYVNEILPINSIKLINSGYCLKNDKLFSKLLGNKIYGYVLSNIADLGDGLSFLKKIINGSLIINDLDSKIENIKYKLFINFMLQALLSIEHLHQSKYEIFHGDLKPSNFLVKTSDKNIDFFVYKINKKIIRVKNIGFTVLIIDFDTSSLTLKSRYDNKDFRIVPKVLLNNIFRSWFNSIEKQYANKNNEQDLDMYKNKKFIMKGKHLPDMGILSYLPSTYNPLIVFYRGAGINYFMDIDVYTLAILILTDPDIKPYCIKNNSIYTTLFSFLSPQVYSNILEHTINNESVNKAVSLMSTMLDKYNLALNKIFTNQYIKDLQLINYKLFGKT